MISKLVWVAIIMFAISEILYVLFSDSGSGIHKKLECFGELGRLPRQQIEQALGSPNFMTMQGMAGSC